MIAIVIIVILLFLIGNKHQNNLKSDKSIKNNLNSIDIQKQNTPKEQLNIRKDTEILPKENMLLETIYVSEFSGLSYGAGRGKVVAIRFKDLNNDPVNYYKEHSDAPGKFHIGNEEIQYLMNTYSDFPIKANGMTFTQWGYKVEEYVCRLMLREEGLLLIDRSICFKWRGKPWNRDK